MYVCVYYYCCYYNYYNSFYLFIYYLDNKIFALSFLN